VEGKSFAHGRDARATMQGQIGIGATRRDKAVASSVLDRGALPNDKIALL